MNYNVVIIIEARMGSSRLPGKVLKPLAGIPLLTHLIQRIAPSKYSQKIVIATSNKKKDDALETFANDNKIAVWRGSEEDVLSRIVGAAENFSADIIVSLTGDNPMIDSFLIDDMVDYFLNDNYDYVTNTYMQHTDKWKCERTFPRGISVQIYWKKVLKEVDREFRNHSYREHITFGIYHRDDNKYKLGGFAAEGKYLEWKEPELRFTIDTQEDYNLMNNIFNILYPSNKLFSSKLAIRLVKKNKNLKIINAKVAQKIAYKELDDY